MKRTKVQEAIDHIAGVRRGAKQHNDTYIIRVCTTVLEAGSGNQLPARCKLKTILEGVQK